MHCSCFSWTMWTPFVLLVLLSVTDTNCNFTKRICPYSKGEQKENDCRKCKNNKNGPRVLVLVYFLEFQVMVLSISIFIFHIPGGRKYALAFCLIRCGLCPKTGSPMLRVILTSFWELLVVFCFHVAVAVSHCIT